MSRRKGRYSSTDELLVQHLQVQAMTRLRNLKSRIASVRPTLSLTNCHPGSSHLTSPTALISVHPRLSVPSSTSQNPHVHHLSLWSRVPGGRHPDRPPARGNVLSSSSHTYTYTHKHTHSHKFPQCNFFKRVAPVGTLNLPLDIAGSSACAWPCGNELGRSDRTTASPDTRKR